VQECAGAAVPGRSLRGVPVGADGQDALDGPVGRVPGRDRLGARGLEPGRVMPVGHGDHALGGAQPVKRVVREQPADDLLTRRADRSGLLAAPGRGAHVEGESSPAGSRRSRSACPRSCGGWVLTRSPPIKNCTIVSVTRMSAVLPMCRHGAEYKTLPTRAWMSGPIFAFAHTANTNGSAGSGLSASFSAAANTAAGAAPSSGRHCPRPRCTSVPPLPASAPARRTAVRARTSPVRTASAVPPAACPSAGTPGPDRAGTRNARPARHRTG
jgi:hypothetical protein